MFIWQTAFPEPGLSAALADYKDQTDDDDADSHVAVCHVIMARNIMHHFGVPQEAVGERMRVMGMATVWASLLKYEKLFISDVPRREAGDTR
jgi:hypothetical protein